MLACCMVLTTSNIMNKDINEVYAVESVVKTEIHNISTQAGLNYKLNTAEYNSFIDSIKKSVVSDVNTGFKSFALFGGSSMVSDHVVLPTWGKFLYAYAYKSVSAMPIGGVKINIGAGKSVILKDDRNTKTWVKDILVPLIHKTIIETCKTYNCNVHVYDFDKPVYFTDFDIYVKSGDKDVKTKVIKTIKAFGGIKESDIHILVHSVGSGYGVQLDSQYVSLLSASGTKDSLFTIMESKSGEINVLSNIGYIVTPKVIKGKGLLSDMTLADGLGINLATKEVIKLNSLETFNYKSLGTLDDNKWRSDSFVMMSKKDALCLVPTVYNEYFKTTAKELPTGVTVDITDYLMTGGNVKVSSGETDNFGRYISSDGLVSTKVSKGNKFLLFADTKKLPYNRILKWLVSDKSSTYVSQAEKESLLKALEKIYSKAGKRSEYTNIVSNNNNKLSILKTIGIILGLVILVCVIYNKLKGLKKRGKNTQEGKNDKKLGFNMKKGSLNSETKNKSTKKQELLFDMTEEDDE